MTARLFAAADGGNSKTDVVLGDSDGRILARITGPTTSPHVLGLAAAVAQLGELVVRARAAAALPASIELDRLSVYVAGADLPFEVEQLNAEVGALGLAEATVVDNDLFALLRAGTPAPDAVGVVCGAGINAAGRRADGATSRFPALGPISGDWGGGADMGAAALWHAVRDEDGRGPRTLLRTAVTRHFGTGTVAEVTAALHSGVLPELRLSELCPAVFTACDQDDPTARALVKRLADEVAGMAVTVLRRLGLDGAGAGRAADPEVILGGSVLASRHPLLLARIEQQLAEAAPPARALVSTAPPLLGAALAALDLLARPADVRATAADRLRAAFGSAGSRAGGAASATG